MTTSKMIGGATRRLMAAPEWPWRHSDYAPADEAESRAALILRRDYRRAAAWLRSMSDRTTLPLPLGNGTNGPWNRVAHVTDDGRLGIVDIAAGRAAIYDVAVPHHVSRFASAAVRAVSHHAAGGTGGVPVGWRQIAVMLSDRPCPTTPPMAPAIIIYGLSTCYGTIGGAPTSDEYGTEWSSIASCPASETTEPQRETVRGIEPSESEAREFIRAIGGNPDRMAWSIVGATVDFARNGLSRGETYMVEPRVTATRSLRDVMSDRIRRAWSMWTDYRLAAARQDQMRMLGLVVAPADEVRAPSREVWRIMHGIS